MSLLQRGIQIEEATERKNRVIQACGSYLAFCVDGKQRVNAFHIRPVSYTVTDVDEGCKPLDQDPYRPF